MARELGSFRVSFIETVVAQGDVVRAPLAGKRLLGADCSGARCTFLLRLKSLGCSRWAANRSASSAHQHLQLLAPIVDDQHVELPQHIHADEHDGIFGHVPVLEDMQVARRDVGLIDLHVPRA